MDEYFRTRAINSQEKTSGGQVKPIVTHENLPGGTLASVVG